MAGLRKHASAVVPAKIQQFFQPVAKQKHSLQKNSSNKNLNVNVRSIKKNLSKLESLILSFNDTPDILCLTETWLNDEDDPELYLVNGYTQVKSKNRSTKGGGVMIQCKRDITITKEIETNFEECVFLEINTKTNYTKLAVIYNKPRTNKTSFLKVLEKFLEKQNSLSKPFVLCGDLNIDTVQQNQLTKDFLNCITSNSFKLANFEPTRVTESSSTCLDHFIYQNLKSIKVETLEHENFSDHYPVLLT